MLCLLGPALAAQSRRGSGSSTPPAAAPASLCGPEAHSTHAAALMGAASAAICTTAGLWPLPATLEHICRPLLLSLAGGPDVAVTLVGLGHAVGGAMAARHLVPALLMVLVSSRSLLAPTQGDTVPASDSQPGLRQLKSPGSGLQGTEGACRKASLMCATKGLVQPQMIHTLSPCWSA